MVDTYNVFVSYASINNDPILGEERGWVTDLVSCIELEANNQLGRRDELKVWMDFKLDGCDCITPEIMKALTNSDTLLLILSPAYVASEWCLKELSRFILQYPVGTGRIFMVEHDLINKPSSLKDLKGFKFFNKTPEGRVKTWGLSAAHTNKEEYHQEARKIGQAIAKRVKRIKEDKAHKSSSSLNVSEYTAENESLKNSSNKPRSVCQGKSPHYASETNGEGMLKVAQTINPEEIYRELVEEAYSEAGATSMFLRKMLDLVSRLLPLSISAALEIERQVLDARLEHLKALNSDKIAVENDKHVSTSLSNFDIGKLKPTQKQLTLTNNLEGESIHDRFPTEDDRKNELLDRFDQQLIQLNPLPFILGKGTECEVKIEKINPFLISKYQVTQDMYRLVMGKNPSEKIGDHFPVESVSWFDAVSFCNALSEKHGLEPIYIFNEEDGSIKKIIYTNNGFRLPTEAEWEYAAAPDDFRREEIGHVAWYQSNAGMEPHPVGEKLPNIYGIYDMLGNVWEWCNDWFGGYNRNVHISPAGLKNGVHKVRRGGSCANYENNANPCFRNREYPEKSAFNIGFRVVRAVDTSQGKNSC